MRRPRWRRADGSVCFARCVRAARNSARVAVSSRSAAYSDWTSMSQTSVPIAIVWLRARAAVRYAKCAALYLAFKAWSSEPGTRAMLDRGSARLASRASTLWRQRAPERVHLDLRDEVRALPSRLGLSAEGHAVFHAPVGGLDEYVLTIGRQPHGSSDPNSVAHGSLRDTRHCWGSVSLPDCGRDITPEERRRRYVGD